MAIKWKRLKVSIDGNYNSGENILPVKMIAEGTRTEKAMALFELKEDLNERFKAGCKLAGLKDKFSPYR